MEEQSLGRGHVKGGTISDIIQKEAKKISSPVISDFLIAARRGFKEQVLQGLKEGGSRKACSTDKVFHGTCLLKWLLKERLWEAEKHRAKEKIESSFVLDTRIQDMF